MPRVRIKKKTQGQDAKEAIDIAYRLGIQDGLLQGREEAKEAMDRILTEQLIDLAEKNKQVYKLHERISTANNEALKWKRKVDYIKERLESVLQDNGILEDRLEKITGRSRYEKVTQVWTEEEEDYYYDKS